MIPIVKHIVNKSIKRTVLWVVLLLFATHGNSTVCVNDTIIIDGSVIDLQLREVSEEELKEERLKNAQADSLPNFKNPVLWELSGNGGVSYNKSSSSSSSEFLNNYISQEKTSGSFGSFQFQREVWKRRRNHLKVGIGLSSWTQSVNQVQNISADSILSFNSPVKGELEYSIWIGTNVGGEIAKIDAGLKNQVWRQMYLEVPISYSFDLLPGRNECLSLGVGLFPGVLVQEKISDAHFVDLDLLEIVADNSIKASQFNISSELMLRYSKMLQSENNLFLQFGYRDNFKDLLSDYNLLDFSRKSLFLGVGFCFYSHKGNI